MLTELFSLGAAVDAGVVATALRPADVAALIDADLLRSDGTRLRSPVRIAAFAGVFVVHDPQDVHPTPADHVAGTGPATRTLAGLTVRRRVDRALDLGTGCGVQALLAAAHADEIVATDLNPRALHLAAASAALNDRTLDLRLGSLFDPVQDETFGVIAANPPFVVSPDTDLVFRDGNVAGDAISPSVVMGAASHLDDGGFATVLCSWIRRRGETWMSAPERWVKGQGCDAWILHHRADEPLEYATNWNAFVRHEPDTFTAAIDRWLEYYREAGVDVIDTGAVILRRRSQTSWLRFDEMPDGPRGDATEHILRVFAAADDEHRWRDDETVLAATAGLVGPHRLDQVLSYTATGYATHPSRLRLDDGVGLAEEVLPHLMQFLLMLDDTTAVGTVAAHAADALGSDPVVYATEAAALVRRLHAAGFATLRT